MSLELKLRRIHGDSFQEFFSEVTASSMAVTCRGEWLSSRGLAAHRPSGGRPRVRSPV